ncbi:PREDICTED: uncharacterized protein LOC109225073 [Nicotiana attenuata]|uniref:uncharacterized protein LOC109225073 n=1 Tax=Nicotiana attenuata TaxID=49451 RepID=UPI0009051459|nr:PREDICTED: uncharacterized protein LOC109225073 [Nicotiana attenuata]
MKNRVNNKIRSLKNTADEIIQSRKTIEMKIVGFYKGLLGAAADSIPAIQPSIMREGNVLDRKQQLKLIEDVTIGEIQLALKGIDELKATGFNSKFFKKTWGITWQEVSEAVLQFFNKAEMYRPINVTTVTLIPKIQHPSTVKDFRPIS